MYVLIPIHRTYCYPDAHRLSLPNTVYTIYVQRITANKRSDEYPDSIFVINKPTWVELEGVLSETSYYGRAWADRPHVCFQYAGGLSSLNPDGWDMKSAGNVAFTPKGFEEWPAVIGKKSNLAPREYLITEFLPK